MGNRNALLLQSSSSVCQPPSNTRVFGNQRLSEYPTRQENQERDYKEYERTSFHLHTSLTGRTCSESVCERAIEVSKSCCPWRDERGTGYQQRASLFFSGSSRYLLYGARGRL